MKKKFAKRWHIVMVVIMLIGALLPARVAFSEEGKLPGLGGALYVETGKDAQGNPIYGQVVSGENPFEMVAGKEYIFRVNYAQNVAGKTITIDLPNYLAVAMSNDWANIGANDSFIKEITKIADNQIQIKFQENITPTQGSYDFKFTLDEIASGGNHESQFDWSISQGGTGHIEVIVKNEDEPIPTPVIPKKDKVITENGTINFLYNSDRERISPLVSPEISYTITYNTNVAVNGLSITDKFPEGLSLVSGSLTSSVRTRANDLNYNPLKPLDVEPTVTEQGFSYNNVNLPENSEVTITYKMILTEESLQKIDAAGVSGGQVTLDTTTNTVTFVDPSGTTEIDETPIINKEVSRPAAPENLLEKKLGNVTVGDSSTPLTPNQDGSVTLPDDVIISGDNPLYINYEINADLTKYQTSGIVLDKNILLTDKLNITSSPVGQNPPYWELVAEKLMVKDQFGKEQKLSLLETGDIKDDANTFRYEIVNGMIVMNLGKDTSKTYTVHLPIKVNDAAAFIAMGGLNSTIGNLAELTDGTTTGSTSTAPNVETKPGTTPTEKVPDILTKSVLEETIQYDLKEGSTTEFEKPIPIHYTIEADLAKFTLEGSVPLEGNVILADTLPKGVILNKSLENWLTVTKEGSAVTISEYQGTDYAGEFRDNDHIGCYYTIFNESKQLWEIFFNLGNTKDFVENQENYKNKYTIQLTVEAVEKPDFKYENRARWESSTSSTQKGQSNNVVTGAEEIIPETEKPDKDKSIFSKNSPEVVQIKPGEPTYVPYQLILKGDRYPADSGSPIHIYEAVITDTVDLDVFEAPNPEEVILEFHDSLSNPGDNVRSYYEVSWKQINEHEGKLVLEPTEQFKEYFSDGNSWREDGYLVVSFSLKVRDDVIKKSKDNKVNIQFLNEATVSGLSNRPSYKDGIITNSESSRGDVSWDKRVANDNEIIWDDNFEKELEVPENEFVNGNSKRFIYRIAVTPHGYNVGGTGIYETDTLPAGVNYVSFIKVNPKNGRYSQVSQVMENNIEATLESENKLSFRTNGQQLIDNNKDAVFYVLVEIPGELTNDQLTNGIVNIVGNSTATIKPKLEKKTGYLPTTGSNYRGILTGAALTMMVTGTCGCGYFHARRKRKERQ